MIEFDSSQENFLDAFGVSRDRINSLLMNYEQWNMMKMAEDVLKREEITVAEKFIIFMDLGSTIGRIQITKELGLNLPPATAVPEGAPVH